MQLKHLGLTCLLIATALPALSESPPRRGERDAVRAFYLQQTGNERAVSQEETQSLPRQVEQRGQVYAMPDTSGYSAAPDSNAEQRRRSGRMSPEERRALRRQIDEVGHDIYTQKR